MNPTAYFISFLIGYLTIEGLTMHKPVISKRLKAALAISVGFGISAYLTFAIFIIFKHYSATALIGAHFFLLGFLVIVNRSILRAPRLANFTTIFSFKNWKWWTIAAGLSWTVYFMVIYFQAIMHPFGEWDAWALYNLKLKFFLLSADPLRDILQNLHWHTQPDYPLGLPLFNVWSFSISGAGHRYVPLMTSVFFTMSCGIILYCGLKEFINGKIAFFVSCLMLAHPYYIFFATGQYADIILSVFLLSSIIAIFAMIRAQDKHFTLVCGMIIGMMTFIKNEGIVMAVLLTAAVTLYLLLSSTRDKSSRHLIIRQFIIGVFLTAVIAAIFKIFLAPANRDMMSGMVWEKLSFLNLQGLSLIMQALWTEITDKRWCYIWYLIFFMIVFGFPKFFRKENKLLTLFFLTYFIILIVIYLTTMNFDLSWRLEHTLRRIFFLLLPSILFFCFYTYYQPGFKKNNG